MGIYDVKWLDNNSIVTCSADNTIKTWNVTAEGQVEIKNTFVQKDGPRDTSLQLSGLAESKDQHLTAVNLSGELTHFENFVSTHDRHPTKFIYGHQNLISDIQNFDKFIVYSSEANIFYFDVSTPNEVKRVENLPNKTAILELFSNNHSVYATTLDKLVLRLSAEENSIKLVKSLDLKNSAAKAITAADDVIYVLKNNGEVDEIDAFELSIKNTRKFSFDATALAYSSFSKELWAGDKKGLLHVLNTADFAEIHTIEKHSKTITVMTVSADGAKIASGDAYRYQYIWDSASREMIGEHGF